MLTVGAQHVEDPPRRTAPAGTRPSSIRGQKRNPSITPGQVRRAIAKNSRRAQLAAASAPTVRIEACCQLLIAYAQGVSGRLVSVLRDAPLSANVA